MTDPCEACAGVETVALLQAGCGIAHCGKCNRRLETPLGEATPEEIRRAEERVASWARDSRAFPVSAGAL